MAHTIKSFFLVKMGDDEYYVNERFFAQMFSDMDGTMLSKILRLRLNMKIFHGAMVMIEFPKEHHERLKGYDYVFQDIATIVNSFIEYQSGTENRLEEIEVSKEHIFHATINGKTVALYPNKCFPQSLRPKFVNYGAMIKVFGSHFSVLDSFEPSHRAKVVFVLE